MMGSWAAALVALAVAVLFVQAPGERAPFTVWAVHDGVKVKRDDRAHPDRARNAVWDGSTIRLVAARNEVIAFQVIVEAGESGLEGLTAGLARLAREGSGGTIAYRAPAVDPTEYRDRPIQVFGEHYMSVTRGSRATWVFRPDSPTAPRDALGWMPGAARSRERDERPRRLPASRRGKSEPGVLVRRLRAARDGGGLVSW